LPLQLRLLLLQSVMFGRLYVTVLPFFGLTTKTRLFLQKLPPSSPSLV